MKMILALSIVSCLTLAGCGGDKFASKQAPPASGQDSDDGGGQVVVAKQKKTKTKRAAKPKTAPAPVEVAPVVAVAPPLAPVEDVPVVVILPPAPTPAKPSRPYVVGMGSASKKPDELFEQGPNGAILNANFCAISGHFASGASRCYLVYSDGRTAYSDAGNSVDGQAFAAKLKADEKQKSDAKKALKKQKKQKN